MSDPLDEEIQVWIAKGISPANKTRLMVMYGVSADVIDAVEILVRDNYPWRKAMDVAAAMKRNEATGSRNVVEQAKHFVMLRAAAR